MPHPSPFLIGPPNDSFFDRLFSAQAVEKGGIVRRSVRSVEEEVGRTALIAEVEARGFHLVESGSQFIIFAIRATSA